MSTGSEIAPHFTVQLRLLSRKSLATARSDKCNAAFSLKHLMFIKHNVCEHILCYSIVSNYLCIHLYCLRLSSQVLNERSSSCRIIGNIALLLRTYSSLIYFWSRCIAYYFMAPVNLVCVGIIFTGHDASSKIVQGWQQCLIKVQMI